MKGVFLINSLEGGGAEKVFCKLIELINNDKNIEYEFEIIILDKYEEVYSLPEKIKINRIGHESWLILQLIKYIILIFKLKPDFVLSFLPRANFFNTITGLLLNHKSIISERSNTNGRLSGSFKLIKKTVILWVFRRSSLVIAVSKGVSDCLINEFSVPKNKVVLLNNPYDLENIKLLSMSNYEDQVLKKPYIVAMGRLVKTKGFDDLIIAYSKIKTDHQLVIIGKGEELERLKRLAVDNSVGKKVHFLGFKNNPYPVITGADFFVLPSYLEGFPNALVEAMALSKPILSTNCKNGPSDILDYDGLINLGEIVETKYGIMINTGDIKGLTFGLKTLLESEEMKKKYSERSIKRAKYYSQQKFYNKYKKIIIDEVLK